MAKIFEITDFSAPELDIYARLTENQLVNRADPENAMFIAESPMVIIRALDAGCGPVSLLMEHRHIKGKGAEILKRCGDIPVSYTHLMCIRDRYSLARLCRPCPGHSGKLPTGVYCGWKSE